MINLNDIRKPVRLEMKEFNKRFKSSISSNIPLVNLVTTYVLKRKGKQMRPLFVFLTSKMTGEITPSTYTAASLIELMHTATLVHDDVVDDSNERRGAFSVKAIWKSKIAVLLGDFLLAKGLILAVQHKEYDLLEIVSNASREMSEGELLQLQKSRSLNLDITTYYEVIRKKTATLIAACCAMGAQSVNATPEKVEIMREFGELIGIAFQIKDDLFDYGDEQIGKPTGIDIKEQKMTLPLIFAINNASEKDKKWLINSVKNHNKDKKRVKEIIQFVKEHKGLEYAVLKMKEHQSKALELLQSYPPSPFKESLELMVNYVIDRKK